MRPSAVALTATGARRWRSAGVPWWLPRVVLPVGWVVVFLVCGSTEIAPCTPEDPAVCGPDVWWAVTDPLWLATPLLLWWRPRLGCALGAAYGAFVVGYDTVLAARVTFGLHGVACALVLVWLLRGARAQARVAGELGGGIAVPVPSTDDATPVPSWRATRVAAVLVAVVAAVGLFGWYRVEVGREAVHVARAVQVPAEVVAVDDVDYLVTLALDQPAARQVEVEVWDAYPVGASVPVLVDPDDPAWVRLVAEPGDHTWWLTGAIAALLAAGILIAAERERRTAWRRLSTGEHRALEVRVVDVGGRVLVLPADRDGAGADVPVAVVPVLLAEDDDPAPWDLEDGDEEDWDEESSEDAYVEDFGRLWRGEDVDDEGSYAAFAVPAVLVGAFHDGGWAAVVTDERVLVPSAPVRLAPSVRSLQELTSRLRERLPFERRWGGGASDGRESDGVLPGRAVQTLSAPVLQALPLVVGASSRGRRVGAAQLLGGLLAAPLAALVLAEDTYQVVVLLVIGAEMVFAGLGRLGQRIRVKPERLEVTTAVFAWEIPWSAFHGMRRDGREVYLAWAPDHVVGLSGTALDDHDDPAAATDELGGTMSSLRERALATEVAPERRAVRRLGPAGHAVALYAVVVAVLVAATAGW